MPLSCILLDKVCICVLCSPEGLEQDSTSASSGAPLRGRSAVGRKHRFDLAARTLLARAGENIPLRHLLPFLSLGLNKVQVYLPLPQLTLNFLFPSQLDCTARCRPTTASHVGRCRPSNNNKTRAPCMTSTWMKSWRWTWTRRPWRPCSDRTLPVTPTFWECGSRRYWTGQHGCVWLYAMARGLPSPFCSLPSRTNHLQWIHAVHAHDAHFTSKPTHSLNWSNWHELTERFKWLISLLNCCSLMQSCHWFIISNSHRVDA